MIITPHILVGATIGSKISSLPLIFITAFLAHFVLDMIPHWEYSIARIKKDKKISKKSYGESLKIAIDSLFAIIIIFLLTRNSFNQFKIMFGGFSGIVPDILLMASWLKPSKPLIILKRFHYWIHCLFKKERFNLIPKQGENIDPDRIKTPKFSYFPWGIIFQVILSLMSIYLIF